MDKVLDMRLEGGDYPRYLFKLISKSLRVITFEVDFSGSHNVEFYEDDELDSQPTHDIWQFQR